MIAAVKRYSNPLLFALAVALVHASLWLVINRALPLIDAPPIVHGFAYSGFQVDQSPLEKKYPSTSELVKDLRILEPYTDHIRTYGAIENPEVVALAAVVGLKVAAGAWISPDEFDNEREIRTLLAKAELYPNIERLIIGNEVLLRNDIPVEKLIEYLDHVNDETELPISTAEPWHVWLKNPELVKHVDFIAVHLLPYHEGVPVEQAVNYTIERYKEIMAAYPRKKIVITEIGWPSRGPTIGASVASQVNQARFVREFLAKTAYQNYDYYLMEAFDQPWKVDLEGWAGAYWGMFDGGRNPKYSLAGAIPKDTRWITKAAWSTLIAFLPILFIAYRFRHWRLGGRLSMALLLQACITTLVIAWSLPGDYYYTLRDFIVLIGLIFAMMLTSAVLMIYGVEFSEVMFKGGWRRFYKRATFLPPEQQKFVSVHLACYNEPPEMVIKTIESLSRLYYANFEVIVVDNNTRDEALWKPVEAFAEPQVAVVQAPQAHRDWENNFFRRMSNWEFEGFFRIGMHHRHERNALIQHGTMTLVRKQALDNVGGWSEWCICEDTELGLRLLEDGHELRYVDETFGRGLTPSNYNALKSQRFRWAFGAMQILKHHLPKLLGKSTLTFGQRYHFLTGWFGWLGDALQLFFTLGSIGWTLAMLAFPKSFSLPVSIMLTPILCFLIIKGALGPVLYRRTMDCSWKDIFGASLAGLGLSHSIAKGIILGLVQKRGIFKPTAKGKSLGGKLSVIEPIREEVLLLLALILSALAMLMTRGFDNLDAQLWVAMLSLQSLPYISAVACQIIAQMPDSRPKQLQQSART